MKPLHVLVTLLMVGGLACGSGGTSDPSDAMDGTAAVAATGPAGAGGAAGGKSPGGSAGGAAPDGGGAGATGPSQVPRDGSAGAGSAGPADAASPRADAGSGTDVAPGTFRDAGGAAAVGKSWSGMIGGRRFFLPDTGRPVRAVLINNNFDPAGGSSGDLFTNADWRALALKQNLALTEWHGRYNTRAASQTAVTEIIATLTEAAQTLHKPEIQYTAVFLQGLSGTSCDAAWIASFPEFKGRVGGVIAHHEADVEAPAGVPAIYIGDGKDQFGKCCDITQIETVAGYAKAGHPATVSFEPGQEHPSPARDEKFVCTWIDEMINLRFPAAIPTNKNIELPDWNNKSAWIGGYTTSKSSESPWNGGTRPINVWISNQASYTGSEKWIWLPSERLAKAWKTFMETGKFVEP